MSVAYEDDAGWRSTIHPMDVLELLAERRRDKGIRLETMRNIKAYYNNEIVVPLPELRERELPAVANFIAMGIDQHGMRVGSTLPMIDSPVVSDTKGGHERSLKRRQAGWAWYEDNDYRMLARHRGRHLVAYAASPLLLLPQVKSRRVDFCVKDPLDAFPAKAKKLGDVCPDDVIFCSTMEFGKFAHLYPSAVQELRSRLGSNGSPDSEDLIQLATYYGPYETMLIAYGSGQWDGLYHEAEYGYRDAKIINLGGWGAAGGNSWAVACDWAPQRLGACPVTMPYRIGLGDGKGQFDDSAGLFQLLATMMALDVNAVGRSIYPDFMLVSNPNETVKVIRNPDGMRGVYGEIEGGTVVPMNMQPNFQAGQTMDRIERSLRQTGSIPSEYGGESPTNVRTDRRGNTVVSMMTDFHIQEHQELLAVAAKAELSLAAQMEMAYFGDKPKSFHVTWGKKPGKLDYKPNEIFTESTAYTASYPFAGLDSSQVTVELAQQIGDGTLSPRSAMEQSQNVDDPDAELARINADAVTAGLRQGIQQQIISGQIPPKDGARMIYLMEIEKKSLAEAVVQVDEEAQARQASAGPPGTPAGPAAPGSPEAQLGLSAGPAGAASPVGGPIAPPQGLLDLRSELNALRAQAPVQGAPA